MIRCRIRKVVGTVLRTMFHKESAAFQTSLVVEEQFMFIFSETRGPSASNIGRDQGGRGTGRAIGGIVAARWFPKRVGTTASLPEIFGNRFKFFTFGTEE